VDDAALVRPGQDVGRGRDGREARLRVDDLRQRPGPVEGDDQVGPALTVATGRVDARHGEPVEPGQELGFAEEAVADGPVGRRGRRDEAEGVPGLGGPDPPARVGGPRPEGLEPDELGSAGALELRPRRIEGVGELRRGGPRAGGGPLEELRQGRDLGAARLAALQARREAAREAGDVDLGPGPAPAGRPAEPDEDGPDAAVVRHDADGVGPDGAVDEAAGVGAVERPGEVAPDHGDLGRRRAASAPPGVEGLAVDPRRRHVGDPVLAPDRQDALEAGRVEPLEATGRVLEAPPGGAVELPEDADRDPVPALGVLGPVGGRFRIPADHVDQAVAPERLPSARVGHGCGGSPDVRPAAPARPPPL